MTTAVNLLPLPTPLEEPPPNPPSWVWGNGSSLDSSDGLYDDGYDEGSLILNGNLWNTEPTSTGTVTMTYNASAGSLTTVVSFSNWIASSPSSGNPSRLSRAVFWQRHFVRSVHLARNRCCRCAATIHRVDHDILSEFESVAKFTSGFCI